MLPNGKLDVYLSGGKTEIVSEGRQAVQHAVQRLMKKKGESVTGNPNEEGTDWYGIIFNMEVPRAAKELHLKKRILGTPGIKKIVNFSFEQIGRAVNISSLVLTDSGTTEDLTVQGEF